MNKFNKLMIALFSSSLIMNISADEHSIPKTLTILQSNGFQFKAPQSVLDKIHKNIVPINDTVYIDCASDLIDGHPCSSLFFLTQLVTCTTQEEYNEVFSNFSKKFINTDNTLSALLLLWQHNVNLPIIAEHLGIEWNHEITVSLTAYIKSALKGLTNQDQGFFLTKQFDEITTFEPFDEITFEPHVLVTTNDGKKTFETKSRLMFKFNEIELPYNNGKIEQITIDIPMHYLLSILF